MTNVEPIYRDLRLARPLALHGMKLFRMLGFLLPFFLASDILSEERDTALESRVTEHVLSNGWTFLLLEKPGAPVVTFFTMANVGSSQETSGSTGLAHMFEHMAFKGSRTLGTLDIDEELEALEDVEQAYAELTKIGSTHRDDIFLLKALDTNFRSALDRAESYVDHNAFRSLIDQQGGVGLHAFTNVDVTGFKVSLPSNKIELWAKMESDRFLNPIFRQFYREKKVVEQERTLRLESGAGKLFQEFVGVAFTAHPYQHPVLGYATDLASLSATDARRFYSRHYVPGNMTSVLIGDVNPQDTIRLLERYFGEIPEGSSWPRLRAIEPPQAAERRTTVYGEARALFLEGYHIPALRHPDFAVLKTLAHLLATGRNSVLYRELVGSKGIATQVSAIAGYPGSKYPSLFAIMATPSSSHTLSEVEEAIHQLLAGLKEKGVGEELLEIARRQAQVSFARKLEKREELARHLAFYHVSTGDWRNLFRELERLREVTSEDIHRVIDVYFVSENRTVAHARPEIDFSAMRK